jgi:CCR4-NOT transcriptional regulation complex NOT5 subunit
MERFKAMERELKTKAYSQAGLMSGLKYNLN